MQFGRGSQKVSEAIIGLIGVIVGGLLSATAAYLAARSLEGRKVAAQTRASARLVNQELKRASLTLHRILKAVELREEDEEAERAIEAMKKVKPGEKLRVAVPPRFGIIWLRSAIARGHLPELSTQVWEEHQPRLAEALSDPEWQSVEAAYERMGEVEQIEARVRENRSVAEESTASEAELGTALDAIDEARMHLEVAASRSGRQAV